MLSDGQKGREMTEDSKDKPANRFATQTLSKPANPLIRKNSPSNEIDRLLGLEEESGYKAFEKQRSGTPAMLELRYNGHSHALNYAYLRGFRTDFRKEKHVIELFTPLGRVTITGIRLEELKNALLENSVSWIQQFYQELHSEDENQEGKAVIEEIEFEGTKEK